MRDSRCGSVGFWQQFSDLPLRETNKANPVLMLYSQYIVGSRKTMVESKIQFQWKTTLISVYYSHKTNRTSEDLTYIWFLMHHISYINMTHMKKKQIWFQKTWLCIKSIFSPNKILFVLHFSHTYCFQCTYIHTYIHLFRNLFIHLRPNLKLFTILFFIYFLFFLFWNIL